MGQAGHHPLPPYPTPPPWISPNAKKRKNAGPVVGP